MDSVLLRCIKEGSYLNNHSELMNVLVKDPYMVLLNSDWIQSLQLIDAYITHDALILYKVVYPFIQEKLAKVTYQQIKDLELKELCLHSINQEGHNFNNLLDAIIWYFTEYKVSERPLPISFFKFCLTDWLRPQLYEKQLRGEYNATQVRIMDIMLIDLLPNEKQL